MRSSFPRTSTPHYEFFPSGAISSKGARGRCHGLQRRRDCLALLSPALPRRHRWRDRTIVVGEGDLWEVRGAELASTEPKSAGYGRELPITKFAHIAAIVRNDCVGAALVLAACDVPAERCCAAALDCTHHLHLLEADVAAVGFTPSGAVVAEDIRDLQP